MSYSAVQPSPVEGRRLNRISIRIAFSDDRGRRWIDSGAVTRSEPQPLPPPHDTLAAVWEHEVSRLLYDPYADRPARWILLWHRYLRVYDRRMPSAVPLFAHGWISLKTAPDPRGPWSAERKLFVGATYDDVNNVTIGKPEMRLNELAPGVDELGSCVVFTEPGMLAESRGVYVSLRCSARSDGRIVLLRCAHNFTTCASSGTFLRDGEARRFGPDLAGFSGTDLVQQGNRAYLVVTPTGPRPANIYRGCLFFAITSLDDARVRPVPVLRVAGDPDSFNGACAYTPRSVSGVLYGEFFPTPPNFRIFASGLRLP